MAELVLHVVEGPHESEREIALAAGPADIGGGIARVQASGDAAVVEELGPPGRTFVNEQPIHGARVIVPGDRIRVGLTVLELREAGSPAEAVRAPSVPEVPEHVLHLVPDHALVAPEPEPGLPAFRVEETPAAYVPDAERRRSGESGLLAAWRDVHVKQQTQVAAFALLALPGLAVGLWLGFH